MPSLSTIQQTREVLKDVQRIVNNEYGNHHSVFSETDRNTFMGEVGSLQSRLKEAEESEPHNSSWRLQTLLGRSPSPQAAKCLEETKDLRKRVKNDIHTKWRARLIGKSNALGLSFNSMGTRTPETDVPADGTPGQPSEVILSALDIRRSPASEVSQPNADASPAIQNDRDYSPDLNEAINTPLGTSIDQSNDTSTSRPRRSPPPPPPSRRTLQPGSSRILSETTSNADSLRRAPSVRRPAAPTPIQMMQSLRQSGIYLSPITPNTTSLPPSSPQGAPTPAMISSIDSLAQQLTSLASSITKEAHKQQRLGRSASTRTNCVEITGSTVEGLTMNNNAHNCSGAVIHKTVLPSQHPPQHLQQV